MRMSPRSGLRLSGQRLAGIVVDVARGPLVLSGFTIESARSGQTAAEAARYRAVILRSPNPSQDNSFAGEDGAIFLHGAGGGTAIESVGGADVVLKNVYVVGAGIVVMCTKTGMSLPAGGGATDPGPAVRVVRYVSTASGGQVNNNGAVPRYAQNHTAVSWVSEPLQRGAAAVSPWQAGSLPLLHSWDYAVLPSWDDSAEHHSHTGPTVLNVVTHYGATPQWVNSTDDDGARIQRAIDDACGPSAVGAGRVMVFVPHGEYGLAAPLDLRGGCAHFVGAGPHSVKLTTLLHPPGGARDAAVESSGCWPSAAGGGGGGTGAMITSYPLSDASGTQPTLVSGFNLGKSSGCPVIDLQAGNFLLRDVGVGSAGSFTALARDVPREVGAAEVCRDTSYVALRNGVSGRFYGLPLDGMDTRQCQSSPHHVALLVDGCKQKPGGGVHLYQASTEHLINTYQTLINGSTCGVHFHSWKYENALHSSTSIPPYGSGSLVRIEGSCDVSVFGASGNYHLFNASVPIVDVAAGSTNVTAMGMTRSASDKEPPTGLQWLVDSGSTPPSAVGGYSALLFYTSE